jgi:hypothetical protein
MFQDTINGVLLDEELVHSIEEKVSQVLLPKLKVILSSIVTFNTMTTNSSQKRDVVSYGFVRKERLLNSNPLEHQDEFLEHMLDDLQPMPHAPPWPLPSLLKPHSLPPIFHRLTLHSLSSFCLLPFDY